jgi:hypothetical protein
MGPEEHPASDSPIHKAAIQAEHPRIGILP